METRADQIRAFIQDRIRQKAAASRQTPPALDDSLNLVETGLFDSLAFVQLISGIEKEFNLELDTGDLDPEEFTVLGNLVRAAADSPVVAPEAEKK
jgi:acyl carrier protein